MKIKAPLAEAVMRHAKQNIILSICRGTKEKRVFREFLNNLAEMDVTEIRAWIVWRLQIIASSADGIPAYRAHHSFLVNGSTRESMQ